MLVGRCGFDGSGDSPAFAHAGNDRELKCSLSWRVGLVVELFATTNLAAPVAWMPVTNTVGSNAGAFSVTSARRFGNRIFPTQQSVKRSR